MTRAWVHRWRDGSEDSSVAVFRRTADVLECFVGLFEWEPDGMVRAEVFRNAVV